MNLASLAIVGPTASGKSALGMQLARHLGGEIVSCDSVQVYKGFDIGSAKASQEEQREIPHHLIDCVSWREPFDAANYRKLALDAIKDIQSRKRIPIIVGGTGLYFRALCGHDFHDLPHDKNLRSQLEQLDDASLYAKLKTLDPQRAAALHPNDRFRVARACEINMLTGRTVQSLSHDAIASDFTPSFTILCQPKNEILQERIRLRTRQMLEEGLIEEVRSLLAEACPTDIKPMQSIGYKQVAEFLDGALQEDDLFEKILIATRQYARKQRMWFRKVSVGLVSEDPTDVDAVMSALQTSIT